MAKLAMHATAAPLKGCIYVGKLCVAYRRFKVSLAVHVAHEGNVLRRIIAAADCVEAASSSVGMLFLATAFLSRAMGHKRLRVSLRGA
jgi:hypothetical protein